VRDQLSPAPARELAAWCQALLMAARHRACPISAQAMVGASAGVLESAKFYECASSPACATSCYLRRARGDRRGASRRARASRSAKLQESCACLSPASSRRPARRKQESSRKQERKTPRVLRLPVAESSRKTPGRQRRARALCASSRRKAQSASSTWALRLALSMQGAKLAKRVLTPHVWFAQRPERLNPRHSRRQE